MTRQKHHIEALAALLLFAVFALCILAVLLSGTEIYSRLGERDDAAFTERTAEGYIAAKLRQSDRSGGISIDKGTLILAGEQGYETRIYFHEGYICELFTRSGAETSPGAGEQVLPAESLAFSLEDGLLCVELSENGETSLLYFSIKSAGEVLS